MAVPERDVVDRCFEAAHGHITEEVANSFPLFSVERAMFNCTRALVSALEGLAHQIRDADDTQATVLKPMLEEQLADIGAQLGLRRPD